MTHDPFPQNPHLFVQVWVSMGTGVGCLGKHQGFLCHSLFTCSNSHKDLSGQAHEKRHILGMMNHVVESFCLISSASDLNLPSSISQPIPLMLPYDSVCPSIAGCFPCPVSKCGHWAPVSYGKTMSYQHQLSKHIQDQHRKSIQDLPGVPKSPIWTQMLMLSMKLYHIFCLPPDWSMSNG